MLLEKNNGELWRNTAGVVLLVLSVLSLSILGKNSTKIGLDHLKWPADYTWCETIDVEWENMLIYLPENSDRAGYFMFPSCPDINRLVAVELRTESVKDGFRIKEAYQGKKVGTNSVIMEE